MARLTRKELKKDPFLSVYYDDFVEFAQKHYQTMILVALVVIIVVLAGMAWKRHRQNQRLAANTLLGEALATYRAEVGASSPAGSTATQAPAFPDQPTKDAAALKQFRAVYEKYPSQKAGQIALYHVGLCEVELGHDQTAVKILQQAGQVPDRDISSLARFSLAGELAKTGKIAEARSILTTLAEHPTDAVPSATAWLALAEMDRQSNPAEARTIYQRVIKSVGSDTDLASVIQQQLATLPRD